jgi:hypothetical protein
MCLSCTLAKEVTVHLFLGLGVYTGIFALYLQCPLKESKTAIIVFYVLCLLYALSMTDVAMDLLVFVLTVSNNSIRKIIIIQMRIVAHALSSQFQNDSQSMSYYRIFVVQNIVSGLCDFIAQSILVRINHRAYYHLFYSPKSSQRSSVVGSCGAKISES